MESKAEAALAAPMSLASLARDGLIILFFLIHLQVFVSIPVKLNGGPVPGLGFLWALGSLIGLCLAATKLVRTLAILVLLLPFVGLSLWAVASAAWSANPVDTVRTAAFMTGSLVGACAIAAHLSWQQILARFTGVVGFLVLASIFLAVFVPSLGQMRDILQGAWSGVWGEKQAMGMYAALLILSTLSLAMSHQRYWPSLILVPLAFVAIVGTTGKTAILMSLMGIAVWVLGWLIQREVRIAIIALWASTVFGSATLYGLTIAKDELFHLLGRTPDLTGRTEVWREVQFLIDQRPLTGFGYHSIWNDQTSLAGPYQSIVEGTGFEPQNAHSSWLDAQLQLGSPGLILLAIAIGLAWIATIARLPRGGAGSLFGLGALAMLTMTSFTESILLSSMDMPWMLVMLIAAKAMGELFLPEKSPVLSRHAPDSRWQHMPEHRRARDQS